MGPLRLNCIFLDLVNMFIVIKGQHERAPSPVSGHNICSYTPAGTKRTWIAVVVVVVVVLLLTTKSHTNRSHVSNIFTCVVIYSINIFVFCKKHDFLLQKGTMKLTTARLNNLHLTSSTEIYSIVRGN